MKELTIFLKALEETKGLKEGYYIPLIATIDTKFPAIKTLQLSVFYIENSCKKCLSSEKYSFNIEKESKEEATGNIIKTTIKNILKTYGI